MSEDAVVGHATHEMTVQQLFVEQAIDGQQRPYLIYRDGEDQEAWVYPGDRFVVRFTGVASVRIKGNTDQPA